MPGPLPKPPESDCYKTEVGGCPFLVLSSQGDFDAEDSENPELDNVYE